MEKHAKENYPQWPCARLGGVWLGWGSDSLRAGWVVLWVYSPLLV